MRSPRRLAGRVVLIALALVVVAVGAIYGALWGSLATLDGEVRMVGSSAPATITRDALGVPEIVAANRLDLARALGFLHAQERFFQMDLLRRDAAGELSALFGKVAAAHDRGRRFHGLRATARRVIDGASADERALLEAYTAGVNTGLAELAVRPFEYLLLRAAPAPWRAEDSVLAILAMWLTLTDEEAARDLSLTRMHASLPPAAFAFLTQAGSPLDAALDGSAWQSAPLPTPAEFDVRRLAASLADAAPRPIANDTHLEGVLGSNNWAVSAARSAHGGAIVANDMHLKLRVPNIWYRARMRVAASLDLVGATLPGAPAVVVGSNGHIAWGFTNSYVDTADLIELELSTGPNGERRYQTPAGPRAFERREEIIEIARDEAIRFTVLDTIWGPVRESDGKHYAVSWVAHNPAATNFGLMRFESLRTVAEALEAAPVAGMPPQNIAIVDRAGSVGWTLAGTVPPAAPGVDRRRAIGWREAADFHRLDAARRVRRDHTQMPAVLNPDDGIVFTANSRIVSHESWPQLGDGSFALGARQGQIAEGLRSRDKLSEADMLAIALDDRAVFLSRWYELMKRTLARDATAWSPDAREVARLLDAWSGRALPEDAAYRWVREFRTSVHDLVLEGLLHPVRSRYADFQLHRMRQLESVVWTIVTEEPLHLVSPRYASVDALLHAAIVQCIERVKRKHPGPLAERTLGEYNRGPIAHPLTRAVPALGRFLNMPDVAVPGDAFLPRVSRPWGGSSERFAISPGHEDQAYFHMPGGQSGHPMSPFYHAGHMDWVAGRATPMLPGTIAHTLTLRP